MTGETILKSQFSDPLRWSLLFSSVLKLNLEWNYTQQKNTVERKEVFNLLVYLSESKKIAMRLTYKCPHCRAAINAKKNIILAAALVKNKENKGLALLHEAMGNYSVGMSDTLSLNAGDLVEFFCPVCNASLNSEKSDDMACFIRVDETGEETTIFISRKYGERCTFLVDENKRVKSYGDSVKRYLDPDWFK